MAKSPLLVCLLFLVSVAGALRAAEPAVELKPLDHPRLFFTTEDERRIKEARKEDPLLDRLIETNTTLAEHYLEQPTIAYHIPDGKRLLYEARKAVARISTFAMAYRMTGDERFAEAARREMLIAANFKDWNHSHFLDTAELTVAMAIGYDWLYHELDDAERQTIRQAIVKHGLRQGEKVYKRGDWWVVRRNNWNQVCNGAMVAGALAVAEDEPELARTIVDRAIASAPVGLDVYAPMGAYPEGPTYWQFGTQYTCLMLDALETNLASPPSLSETPGLSQTSYYAIHNTSPTGDWFDFSHADSATGNEPSLLWLGRRFNQPEVVEWERKRLDRWMQQEPVGDKQYMATRVDVEGLTAWSHTEPGATNTTRMTRFYRFFPLHIAWYSRPAREVPALPLDRFFDGEQDVVTARSSWDDPQGAWVACKGGNPESSHAQLDAGSFEFEVGGVRWVEDLGRDNYNMPNFFRRDLEGHWGYYRNLNHSHNTLVIDGALQDVKAHCDVVRVASTDNYAAAIVDLTPAYAAQAKSVRRGIELVERRALHVRDELQEAKGTVRWGVVTQADVHLDGSKAQLEREGKKLLATILEPAGAKFIIVDTTPPKPIENPNRGTRMLAIEVASEPNKKLAISVVLQLADGAEVQVEPRSLDEWSVEEFGPAVVR